MSDMVGLVSPASEPIPLVGVKVEGDILGRGARVLVSQRFKNKEETPVEAVYKFPLPEGSAVCGFKARVNGRTISGRVEEREKAFEIYDDALAKGDGGYLLDEERPNIFTLSVGNLNPGTEALIEIEYAVLLDMEGDKIRFLLPTTISPRYIPDGMDEDDGIPVDGKLHPPYASDVPYGLSIALRIHKGSLLESIESPSHQVKVENLRGDPVRVSLSAESVHMDRDFILYMEYANLIVNRGYRCCTDKGVFVQLDFIPEGDSTAAKSGITGDSADLKRELIFLVDCSGSMQGDSIEEARKALEVLLRGLEKGKLFNIHRFGSTHESLFPEAAAYNEKTAEQALAYLESMDADLGGTEILQPLKMICSSTGKSRNSQKDIILLTDGEVANEAQILGIIRKNSTKVRVFSVGIGAGCNEYFIKGLARAGSGASAFIFPGERVEPKVLGLFAKVTKQVVTDLSISWGDASAEQAPTVPVTFVSDPVTVFARIAGPSFAKGNVNVTGKVNGRKQAWEIEVVDLDEQGLPVPLLWARDKIRDLEESGDALLGGSRQSERKMNKVNERIVEISKHYGLLSHVTSYVGVEEREERDRTTGEMELRKVPLLLTVGWHGLSGLRSRAPRLTGHAQYALRQVASAKAMLSLRSPFVTTSDKARKSRLSKYLEQPGASEPPPKADAGRDEKLDVLLHILSLQRPQGGMKLDEKAARVLGIDIHEVEIAARQMRMRAPIQEDRGAVDPLVIMSTAIVILVLDHHFAMERSTWERVVEKSKTWLSEIRSLRDPEIEGQDLMSWAEMFVKKLRPQI